MDRPAAVIDWSVFESARSGDACCSTGVRSLCERRWNDRTGYGLAEPMANGAWGHLETDSLTAVLGRDGDSGARSTYSAWRLDQHGRRGDKSFVQGGFLQFCHVFYSPRRSDVAGAFFLSSVHSLSRASAGDSAHRIGSSHSVRWGSELGNPFLGDSRTAGLPDSFPGSGVAFDALFCVESGREIRPERRPADVCALGSHGHAPVLLRDLDSVSAHADAGDNDALSYVGG